MRKWAYNMLTIRLESTRLVLLEVDPSQRKSTVAYKGHAANKIKLLQI